MTKRRRYRLGETRAIRKIDDALIDEVGDRWDRIVDAGSQYCLTSTEYVPYLERAVRWVEMSHRDAPTPLDRQTFDGIVRDHDPDALCVQVFARGAEVIVGVDRSDCPA
jgi:hypothetical protein